ncbi:NAD(P)H-hydrate dehydratase [Pararhizobium sp. YC-54]|uniref:NAD(P)H-hydrate dehydratase n=1 Tax=Pararhizobium sp. YC-54 TaxID=2986920 RepID=UPI0021F7FD66|nr:NAD(P)H-hydrate dehydratase [Pararhizobium sp. YC-54]MCV9997039.1 NAD(P)H-hydrate dehydratase [Pararhizobium sp. YC-54]
MPFTRDTVIIRPAEMSAIDRDAALSGIDSFRLMTSAGMAVAAAALRLYPDALRFAVLCGPGNNGGDGYIAAVALRQSGADVRVHCLGEPARLKGDAARAHAAWAHSTAALSAYRPQPGDIVIDAVFGAGLARPVGNDVALIMQAVAQARLPVIAVDLPSGVDGRTGQVLGESFRASHTVTFMARKPGHILLPGRTLCGSLEVVDIGIPERILRSHASGLCENAADLWAGQARVLDPSTHKFKRGHLAVFSGGPLTTGAARLSATAGLKAGAGLVTLVSPSDALDANAAHLTAVMLKEIDDAGALLQWLADKRVSAFVLGPGFGDMEKARQYALMLSDRALVLDADGITAFKDDSAPLFAAFAGGETRLVMTPHDGEFARLFADIDADQTLSKVDRAIAAARRSHAVIVYKGADTVIASPDGRAAINTNAPPWLATAGSGDTLAGIIGAHLAQGMPAFEAAAAGVWRHGRAGTKAGEGLTAEELAAAIEPLPAVIAPRVINNPKMSL